MRPKQGARPFLDQIEKKLSQYQPKNGKRAEVPVWDEYFHAVAQAVALRSKDKKRAVGAVIVGHEQVILSTGFNGFPRGIRETEERTSDDEKLFWVTHAETNAIFNAARSGIRLEGTTIYVTTYPCPGCAQAIVQAGIKRVYTYGVPYWIKPRNATRYEIAPDVFAEARVAVDAPRIRAREVPMWLAADEEERSKKEQARAPAAASASSKDAIQRKHVRMLRQNSKERKRTAARESKRKRR